MLQPLASDMPLARGLLAHSELCELGESIVSLLPLELDAIEEEEEKARAFRSAKIFSILSFNIS